MSPISPPLAVACFGNMQCRKIGKNSYICVESYKNEEELFNLQCWALTCETFFSKNEWKWLYKSLNYNRDYEFIYFN